MSNPNQMLTTIQVYPQYFSQSRVEFRLDNKNYTNSMRLVNFGCYSPAGFADATQYVSGCGAWSLIRNATLYSDNVVIEQIRDVYKLMSMKNLLRSNTNSLSRNNFETCAGNGYHIYRDDGLDKIDMKRGKPITNDEATTAKAFLNLSELFSFLDNNAALPKEIGNLRIVLEFENDIEKVYQQPRPATFTIVQPALLVDEVVNKKIEASIEKTVNNTLQMEYYPMELERVTAAGGSAGEILLMKARLHAFDEKQVRRLFIANNSSAFISELLGKHSSVQQDDEKVQFSLNGRTYLPFKGSDTPARKCAYMTDAFGVLNIPLGSEKRVFTRADEVLDKALHLQGNMSYFGMNVNERVDQLHVEFSRTGGALAQTVNDVDLNVYGEVHRVLVIKGENKNVLYV